MSLLPTPRRALLLALRMMAVLAVQAVAGMGLTAQSALAQAIVVRDDRTVATRQAFPPLPGCRIWAGWTMRRSRPSQRSNPT